MEKHVTATEAVRRFSEILNSVSYRGERYVVTRGKKAIADISPHGAGAEQKTLGDLKALIRLLPPFEDKQFARDVRRTVKKQPLPPSGKVWE